MIDRRELCAVAPDLHKYVLREFLRLGNGFDKSQRLGVNGIPIIPYQLGKSLLVALRNTRQHRLLCRRPVRLSMGGLVWQWLGLIS